MAHEDREQPDVSRRELAALLGALGGAAGLAALSSCSSETPDATPERTGSVAQAWGAGDAGASGSSVMWVDTIVAASGTSLRSTTGSDSGSGTGNASNPVAIVGGYGAPNDQGGGVFYWSASTITDDGGTRIVPVPSDGGTSGIGAQGPGWVRVYSGPVNVKWFGALGTGQPGDGGTGGANDRAAIQNAINAASSSPAGAVLIPPGTYVLDSPLNVQASNVTLVGQGNPVLQAGNGIGPDVMPYVLNVGPMDLFTNIVIRDLTIDANQANRTVKTGFPAGCLYVHGSNCLLENITVTKSFGDGASGSSAMHAVGLVIAGSNNRVANCVAQACGSTSAPSDGFYMSGGSQNIISGCIANACTDTGFVIEQSCNYCGIADCSAYGCAAAAAIGNASNADAYGNFIDGLNVYDPMGSTGAVFIGPTGVTNTGRLLDTSVSNVVIHADNATFTGPAISLNDLGLSSRGPIGVTLSNLTIDTSNAANGTYGVYIGPYSQSVVLSDSSIAVGSGGGAAVNVAATCTNILLDGLLLLPPQVFGGSGIGFGVQITGSSYVVVQNCVVRANSLPSSSPSPQYNWAVYAYSGSNVVTSGLTTFPGEPVNGIVGAASSNIVTQKACAQGGTVQLTAGSVTVSSGVTITSGSRIAVTYSTVTTTGTPGILSAPAASRVVGGPGTGSFVIASTSSTDNSFVDYVIEG